MDAARAPHPTREGACAPLMQDVLTARYDLSQQLVGSVVLVLRAFDADFSAEFRFDEGVDGLVLLFVQ